MAQARGHDELGTDHVGALAHARQAPAAATGAAGDLVRIEAGAVVVDRELQPSVLPYDPNRHSRAARIFMRVLKRLLDDPVEHDLHLVRQPWQRLALQVDLYAI